MVNVINSSIMDNFTTVQELTRTPENIQGQRNTFQGKRTLPVLIANIRRLLCAQGHLATLVQNQCTIEELI